MLKYTKVIIAQNCSRELYLSKCRKLRKFETNVTNIRENARSVEIYCSCKKKEIDIRAKSIHIFDVGACLQIFWSVCLKVSSALQFKVHLPIKYNDCITLFEFDFLCHYFPIL